MMFMLVQYNNVSSVEILCIVNLIELVSSWLVQREEADQTR